MNIHTVSERIEILEHALKHAKSVQEAESIAFEISRLKNLNK